MQVGSKKMPCGYHPISAEKKSDFKKNRQIFPPLPVNLTAPVNIPVNNPTFRY
jgi:hypothetical protein